MSNPDAEQKLELANKLIADEGWAWTWAPTSEGGAAAPQFLLPPEGDARRNWCAVWSRIPDTQLHMPHWATLKEEPEHEPITAS